MSVVEALTKELEFLGSKAAESTLAATALTLAAGLDDANSLTSKSMAAKALTDVMDSIYELAPPQQEEDEVERARNRRKARRAAAQAASRS